MSSQGFLDFVTISHLCLETGISFWPPCASRWRRLLLVEYLRILAKNHSILYIFRSNFMIFLPGIQWNHLRDYSMLYFVTVVSLENVFNQFLLYISQQNNKKIIFKKFKTFFLSLRPVSPAGKISKF